MDPIILLPLAVFLSSILLLAGCCMICCFLRRRPPGRTLNLAPPLNTVDETSELAPMRSFSADQLSQATRNFHTGTDETSEWAPMRSSSFSADTLNQATRNFHTETEETSELAPMRSFSAYQLNQATRHFQRENKLGEGGSGPVYKGRLEDGEIVAIKFLKDPNPALANSQFKAEVKTLAEARHGNVVRLLGYCIDGLRRYLIYEYAEHQSLDKHLFDHTGASQTLQLSWETRLEVIQGTAKGLAFLHHDLNNAIVHRDIKAANVLLDKNKQPKIADFGLARLIDADKTHYTVTSTSGTERYMAPEVFTSSHATPNCDTYSFGVLVLEILSGRRVSQMDLDAFALESKESKKYTELIDPRLNGEDMEEQVSQVIEIALKCTEKSPKCRPAMRDVVKRLEEIRGKHERATRLTNMCAVNGKTEHECMHEYEPASSSTT